MTEKKKTRVSYIIRRNNFMRNILETKILGKKGKERPKMKIIKYVMDNMG